MHIFIVGLIVLLLVGLSAICSGLNVAFMSLDLADLRRKAKLGNTYAKRLIPLRKQGHLALGAILLTNIAAVSATSLVLENATGGLIAAIVTTLVIVIFGEVLPQAYFVRRAVMMCGRLIPMLHLMIFITYPVARPLQIILDKLFGPETTRLHTRQELGIIINEHLGDAHSELDEDEVEIIRGALQLSEKRVRDIITPIEKTYWLQPTDVLDSDKIDEIKATGFSRFPVYNRELTICYGVLLIRDLVDVNFDERKYRVNDLPLHATQVVGSMTALDTMFRKFMKSGSHLIPIEADDHIVGVVTIEDLLEEILGHEIEDETDRLNRK